MTHGRAAVEAAAESVFGFPAVLILGVGEARRVERVILNPDARY